MKLNITVAGSGNVSAGTRSKGSDASVASRHSASVARMRGSISCTRRGVNARAAGLRNRPCSGGSRLTIDGCGLCPPSSRMRPASGVSLTSGNCATAAENVSGCRNTCSTSA
jgi:hypothetical protein